LAALAAAVEFPVVFAPVSACARREPDEEEYAAGAPPPHQVVHSVAIPKTSVATSGTEQPRNPEAGWCAPGEKQLMEAEAWKRELAI
jgi:hypothetical protein